MTTLWGLKVLTKTATRHDKKDWCDLGSWERRNTRLWGLTCSEKLEGDTRQLLWVKMTTLWRLRVLKKTATRHDKENWCDFLSWGRMKSTTLWGMTVLKGSCRAWQKHNYMTLGVEEEWIKQDSGVWHVLKSCKTTPDNYNEWQHFREWECWEAVARHDRDNCYDKELRKNEEDETLR